MARLYKKMEIFQLGYSLTVDVIKLVEKLPDKEKDNIASQMRRAVTSIPVNIAEGSVKKSQKEFLNYLSHAYGSAKELEVLLMLCRDLRYIPIKTFDRIHNDLDKLMAKLFGFMENIEGRFENKKRFFTKYKKRVNVRKNY
ncbi:four helix bundle protein [Candidatus Woesearchaeota archaeon]|nr:four helix bundle protein [Candidatus Woesearchaeota archaeon]